MLEMEERDQLPNELFFSIAKYIEEDIDSFSLALSGAIKGFADFYGETRDEHGITISSRCFFLTPRSWNEFFTQHISPEVITNFCANSCYWLPGDQLCSQIEKLKNLENLGICDTKVSLLHLAKVLDTCREIRILDFSYHHLPGIENENSKFATSSVKEAFKKLTALKISTAVLDARDYVNDPWFFIIKMLSWCKDCKKLSIEINFTGEDIEWEPVVILSPLEKEIDRIVREELLPETKWMKSLQSLTLVNSGLFQNYCEGLENCKVRCRLLDRLLYSMFTSDSALMRLASLEHLWIHYFYFSLDMVLPTLPSLKAFRGNDELSDTDDDYERFRDLEHFAGLDFSVPLAHLPNLKTAYGYFFLHFGEDEEMLNFIRGHQNLEKLSIHYFNSNDDLPAPIVNYYVPNVDLQLLKLKFLFCNCRRVLKVMVEEFTVVYPNIEVLQLLSHLDLNDLESRSDVECLSSIRFPWLNSLRLEYFNLLDGSFLPEIIAQCPKLKRINLDGIISEIPSFVSNLDTFLGKALKLQDFRLEMVSLSRDIADVIPILKSLSSHGLKLERIAIEWKVEILPADWDYPLADFIVQLALKMERLTCLSLVFYELDDSKLIEEVNRRMAEEVLPIRPALWFHFGSDCPEASDPSVPAVHFKEMNFDNSSITPTPIF